MTRRLRARGTRRGFTIVEVLVAVVLLAIGVLGLAGVSAVSLRQASTAQLRTNASLIAQTRMERYRSLGCTAITAQLPFVAVTNGVTESVTLLASTNTSRTVRGSFTYATRTGTRVIADTTTILCPQ
jgi:type IV pilus assembly protein PilV